MIVVRSNRAERLVEHLAGRLRTPLSDPFVREVVAVQSRGMERWLSQQLARELGVWAHAEHPFPRRLILEVVASALGEEVPAAGREPYRRERITWLLSQRLPLLCEGPQAEHFREVRRYLEDDATGLKRMQLAVQLAERFDQYLVYRPEMVLGWDAGEGEDWQARAWRDLREHVEGEHVAARMLRAVRAVHWQRERLPERVALFGIATLPPVYLRVLSRLSHEVPVHLYLLAASPAWVADLRPRRRRRKRPGIEAVHQSEGNPLLAAWGRLGRELQQVVEELDYVDEDHFVEPPPVPACTVLQLVQADMYRVVARKPSTGTTQLSFVPTPEEVEGPVALPSDRSILLHRCHSPMREVEVLASELRRLFDATPHLQPHDVVVMTPDIETYGPLVRAVLGADPGSPEHIPFSVSDRPLPADSVVVEGFLSALGVLEGRMGASEVLDLLSCRPVARRFELEDEDRAAIETYVGEAGIRWGVDAADRARFGQPEDPQNTWRFGLDRMLAGVASSFGGLVGGAVPYDAMEGEAAERVGKLCDVFDVLVRFRGLVRSARTPASWSKVLTELLDALFHVEEDELWGAARLREELLDLGVASVEHGGVVGFDVVRWWLEERLGKERSGHRYLRGGVTVCALLPMRSIPFQVVALLGMGVDAFPRSDRSPAFDHIGTAPRPGDRSLREEDRTLFLEAVLSARHHLHVSWVGRSIRDNAELPPSVVVAELLDWIDEAFDGGEARRELVVDHPLQPFDPSYFRSDQARVGRRSTSSSYARGAVATMSARSEPAPFVPVAETPEASGGVEEHVTVDALVRFLQDPARGFLAGIGVRSPHEVALLQDREPLVPDALEQYQIAADLLDRLVDGGELEALFSVLSREGQLPAGVAGRVVFEELRPAVEDVAEAIVRLQEGPRTPPTPIDVVVDGVRITGWSPPAWSVGHVLRQYSRVRARHELGAWARHLLSQASQTGGGRSTWLVGRRSQGRRREVVGFAPVDDPTEHLALLVRMWRRGQERLVAWEPECGRALWGHLRKGKPRTFHLDQVRNAFRTRCREDANWALAFRGRPDLFEVDADDAEWSFEALTAAIHEPMHQARRREPT